MQKLWGDNYFSPSAKAFVTNDMDPTTNAQLPRCFVQFIMKPVITLCTNVMDGNYDIVWKMTESLGIVLKHEEKQLTGKLLMKCIYQKWINAAEALLEMIVMKLPSPKKAQAYRAAYLYEGPIDDPSG